MLDFKESRGQLEGLLQKKVGIKHKYWLSEMKKITINVKPGTWSGRHIAASNEPPESNEEADWSFTTDLTVPDHSANTACVSVEYMNERKSLDVRSLPCVYIKASADIYGYSRKCLRSRA